MGADSKIEWTHHTFNPWRGCTKVSAGCANCYAERQSLRNPKVLGIWGDDGNRVIAAESYWQQPLKWNAAAKAAGQRHRVFCASMADVMEDRPELVDPRQRLFDLIEGTPNLLWLLLSKRPENYYSFLRPQWFFRPGLNVMLGTSVEDQPTMQRRGAIIADLSAQYFHTFYSMEPLIGPIDATDTGASFFFDNYLRDGAFEKGGGSIPEPLVNWVIVGGESGPKARPMHPAWARRLRDQCVKADIPFFFKQWGEFAPCNGPEFIAGGGKRADLYVMEDGEMARIGKHAAGRLLDGREWNQFPICVDLRSSAAPETAENK